MNSLDTVLRRYNKDLDFWQANPQVWTLEFQGER